jgi:heat shock protein HslJ
MKIIPGSSRHHYLAIVSIFLVTAALIIGMVGCGEPEPEYNPMVAAGGSHTVGLKSDGTVVAVGRNDNGQCNVGGWTDIIQVAAGGSHTVGLKSNGTVVAVGKNFFGQCDVGGWTDITQVAAGGHHTVGVKEDGTAVAVGYNSLGQCDVGDWTDITQVAAGGHHTVGLKSNGTVVAVGWNVSGECDVGNWTDIIQVATGEGHTVGLKSDDTAVAVGNNEHLQCNVDSWTDITQDAAIENVIWVLESYGESGNLKAVLKYTEITAKFDGAKISGSAGCNTYGGGYELKGNNISITELWSTLVACREQILKREHEYLTALRDAESYEIEGEKLRIHCGKQLLVFNVRYNRYGQWDTDGWTDIIQVAAGGSHTVGVKSDGTVVAVGDFECEELWQYRIIVAAVEGVIFFAWWPWIIIVAAVVGLVVFFVHKRRAARTKER